MIVSTESHAPLLDAARAALERAYAPYSGFRVGAAVLADGDFFAGCNVENASYGLTICAERVAVFAAVAAGRRRIAAVAVVSEAPAPTAPCGACRQVLYEFGPDMTVLLAAGDAVISATLGALLPMAFGPDDLAGAGR
jgi:cytidine deaminase